MTTSAERTRAIIVGVEAYAHPLLEDIHGPALDACRFARWLTSRGVPESNIELFLSPLPENASACKELADRIRIKAAHEDVIHEYLLRKLPRQSNDVVIIFWGGHGIMDNDQNRVLFTSDADETYQANVQLTALLSSLRTDQYSGNSLQQIIVDSCANFEDISEIFSTLPKRISGHGQQQPSMDQFVLFAADRGERARNDRSAGTGYFSRILLEVLSNQDAEWPLDMTTVFSETHRRMQSLMDTKLGQQSVVCIDYSAPKLGTVTRWVEPKQSRQMISRISATESAVDQSRDDIRMLSDGAIHRFTLRSQMALVDAGRVPGIELDDEESAFAGGLYVRRDLESPLLAALEEPNAAPLLITGKPGAGKTSLLWGLGSTLAARADVAVFFVRAPWMLKGRDETPFDPGVVVSAAKLFSAQGKRVVVLIDTADTLVADEQGLTSLVLLVDDLEKDGHLAVITSRPEEAKLLPQGWARRLASGLGTNLGDYSRDIPESGDASEFERAVASHAAMFRLNHGNNIDVLIHQLVNTVSRRLSMAALCLRPLFLQMLFQLYAPNSVPANLSVSGLYQKYWLDRVQQDKRVRVSSSGSTSVKDLTVAAQLVGLEMLRQGSPEIAPDSIALPRAIDRDQFNADLEMLVARGIGETRGGTFRFFHQTFFEFVAAKGLLDEGELCGLKVLLQRAKIHSGDYFLLAVLEQTWLCAWQYTESRLPAILLAESFLAEMNSKDAAPYAGDRSAEPKLPVSLQQTVMRVVAQAPTGTTQLFALFEAAIAEGPVDLARETLRLLPTPGRAVGVVEKSAVLVAAKRWDKGRSLAIEAFGRLAEGSPEVAVSMLSALGIVPEDVFKDAYKLNHQISPALTDIIISLIPYDEGVTLEALSRVMRHARSTHQPGIIAAVFSGIANLYSELPGSIAEWCTEQRDRTKVVPFEVRSSINMIRRSTVKALINAIGWMEVCALFREALTSAKKDGASERSVDLVGGTLLCIDNTTPDTVINHILDALFEVEDPSVHAVFHLGILVPVLANATATNRERIALKLAEGLPSRRNVVEGLAARWSDTLRRTLERPDFPPEAAAAIGERAAEELSRRLATTTSSIWLDTNILLNVVIKAAAGGGKTARLALKAVVAGEMEVPDAGRRYISQRARSPEGPADEFAVIVSLVLLLGDNQAMLQLTQQHHRHPLKLSGEDAQLMDRNIRKGLGSKSAPEQSLAARLFASAVTAGVIPPPGSDDPILQLQSPEGSVDLAALQVLSYGFNRRYFSPADIHKVLGPYLKRHTSDTSTRRLADKEAEWLRVKVLAATCEVTDWPLLLRSVFEEGADTRRATYATSFVTDAHRLGAIPDITTKVDFVIGFGKALAKARPSPAMSKDIANAWLSTLRLLVRSGRRAEHAAFLEALIDMESRFAGEVASCLNFVLHRDLLEDAKALLDNPALEAHVRERLAAVVRDAAQLAASSAWPEMDSDIAVCLSSSRQKAAPTDS